MIDNKLKLKQYYLEKMPLFMRNSYGIEEQVHLYWSHLIGMSETFDELFDVLGLNRHEDADHTLDIIAEIVGCKRRLDVDYVENSVHKSATLHLTNLELLRFIRTRILQNNYSGGQGELMTNYARVGLNILTLDKPADAGTVSQYLNDDGYLSENDKIMFLSGNYTLKSVGIIYEYLVTNFTMIGTWDSTDSVFDTNYWSE